MNSGTLTVGRPVRSTVEIRERQAAAERFIEQSGSGTAVRALGELRRSPDGWLDRLKQLATSDTTLKVALGVFVGVIAAEAALTVLRSGMLDRLLADIDSALSATPHPSVASDAPSALPILDGDGLSFVGTSDSTQAVEGDLTQNEGDDGSGFDLGAIIDDLLD